MRRFFGLVVLAGLHASLSACDGMRRERRAAGDEARVTEYAAMVLNYPHDEHVFGELPPDLAPVPGGAAELVRETDRVTGTLRTTMTPGHVGKLLAVVINHPDACEAPTPGTACGPHEEEFNSAADGGFYLGDGAVAGPDGAIRLRVTAVVGDTGNVLCGGAANPDFDACANGFALRNPSGAEVTLVLLDNGPASDDPGVLAQQLAAPVPCPGCRPFTQQIAIGFGRETPRAENRIDPARRRS